MAREASVVRTKATTKNNRMQELFLPVHGLVKLWPEEVAIVDHPSFQRLRRVRQLGFAHVVFPGGVHTRLEHSIGAVHVAQEILDNVKTNFDEASELQIGDWRITEIPPNVGRLIRLGALLHDIGHVPFGHTLEDELNHLRPHDGPARVEKIAGEKYKHYDLDKAVLATDKPSGGWSLAELIDALYARFLKELNVGLSPFRVLCLIVCKPPMQGPDLEAWSKDLNELSKSIDLDVCRDIVGNTICADFLDYLFRDWHHLGKTLYEDKRLYEYMEVRAPSDPGVASTPKFVINVGYGDKIRHDALTNILELLEGRYKLAETVLFHRTKLAITGLLDRCLLEIREIYNAAGIPDEDFLSCAEDLLLKGSDDALPDILLQLAEGGTAAGRDKLRRKIEADRVRLIGDVKGSSDLLTEAPASDGLNSPKTQIESDIELIRLLVDRLRDRCIYTMAYKLRISDFTGGHDPKNRRLNKLIELYRRPDHRQAFLRGMESLCQLTPGSLVMYCPPNAAMNAKIAQVNLFIEGDVTPFNAYDTGDEALSLTRGALGAQVRRFYELWSAQVYIERVAWDTLSPSGQRSLRAVLDQFFFQMAPNADFGIARKQVEASVLAVQKETRLAARGGSSSPSVDRFAGSVFPSGLKFECPG